MNLNFFFKGDKVNFINRSKLELIKANVDLCKKILELDLDQIHNEIHSGVLQQARISYHVDFNPEFFFRTKPDLTFSYVNEAFTSYYKKKPDEIIGSSLFSIIPEDYQEQTKTILASLHREKAICTCEYMFNDRNGQIRWRQWTFRAVFDQKNILTEYQFIGRDISEQKEAEAQLLYRLAIEEAIAHVSKLLIGPEEPDIDHVLKIMGKVLAVHRAYIFELRDYGQKAVNTFVWSNTTTCQQIDHLQDLDVGPFAWGLSQLSNNGIFVIPDISALPPEAQQERAILDSQEVQAMLVVPINSTKGEILGYIGMVDIEKSRTWQSEDVQCLSIVGEMLGAFWERKQAEKALIDSEEKFRTLADTAPAIIFVWSLTGDDTPMVYLNPAFQSITGFNVKETLNISCWDLVHPDDRAMVRARGLARIQGELVPDHYEVRFLKDGDVGWGDLAVSRISWDGTPSVMGVIYDISERKEMEEELRHAQNELEMRVKERTAELVILNEKLQQEICERKQAELELKHSENNFRTLAENLPALVYVFNKDRFLYMNSTARSISGCFDEDIFSIDPWQFVHPDFRQQLRQAIFLRYQGETVLPYETKLISKNGLEIRGYLSADLIEYEGHEAILGTIVDITEQKKMEEELMQASKLESLGILAGGIAHDFNNILTIISGNISLANMIMEPKDEIYELLVEVDLATKQARDLTQQLLTFSKGGAPIKEAASIQELLKESANFVLRGSNVNCKFAIPDDLWTVVIDKGQFNQVINNLIINADQAMPDGGTIQLSAENIKLNCDDSLFDQTHNFVKISITDQGIGIAEDQIKKIFDPYFTTKPKGHGLGLPTCYSIIKKHDGDIKIYSDLGHGTTVDIFLPARPELVVEKKNPYKIPLAGQGKILIMDDEAQVRETLGKMLNHLGYQAIFAADGFEAIELYQSNQASGQPCDAVIMDLTIAGGMGGKDAVKRLLELDSQAKVIVSSGYSNDPVMADFKKYGFCGVIPKPYAIEKLNEVLLNASIGNISPVWSLQPDSKREDDGDKNS